MPVSSTRVAEMVKLLENTFRAVNIGLVNEIALMCHKMDIDVWEVIDAAKTKPFGFMPFYPGPGLGGHCIPIDPFYLSWKARQSGFECRFIELAGQVNGVDARVRRRARGRRAEHGQEADQRIARSPVRRGVQERRQRRARVAGARHPRAAAAPRRRAVVQRSVRAVDPAARITCYEHVDPVGALRAAWTASSSAPIIRSFDWKPIVDSGVPIVDTRNALRGFSAPNIVSLSGRAATETLAKTS